MARSNLATRVGTALVLIPVVVGAAYAGNWALAALLSIVSAIAAWEYYRIASAAGAAPLAGVGVPLAALFPLAVHARYLGLPQSALDSGRVVGPALAPIVEPIIRVLLGLATLSLSGAAVLFLAIAAACLWTRGPAGRPLEALATTITGALYTGGMLSFAYALRYHPYTMDATAGLVLLLLPLLLTWVTDTAAYFVGRAIGSHKLMPSVSPGKSVEGAIGGLVVAMLFAWAYQRFVMAPYASLSLLPGAIFLFGAVVSVAGQLGDLTESLIKREAGVKDSSNMIPGHGGVLDRVDSLLFTLPAAYWLLTVMRLIPAMR
jgi:phosphatidate cytidylyltransferase